ncbi:MAG: hypothetical protein ACK47D_00325 [Pseudanabaena sp.]
MTLLLKFTYAAIAVDISTNRRYRRDFGFSLFNFGADPRLAGW